MILEYSYDKAMHILNLIKKNEIASLSIREADKKTYFEYTLVSNYPSPQREKMQAILLDSIAKRMQLLEFINKLIIAKTQDIDFYLKVNFSVTDCRSCSFQYWSSGTVDTIPKETIAATNINKALEMLDKSILDMGSGDVQIQGIFKKTGHGRGTKYTPMTLGMLTQVIRDTLHT